MPGIVGILNKFSREKSLPAIRRMLSSMKHEVWYKSGIYECKELGVSIGWINHEREFSDCMPIFNESRDLVLVFCGETFGYRDLIETLKGKGHNFTVGDGSYLVHLYEEIGHKFFNELNGWFCGVLLDYRKRIGFIFNDRYGMNRIFIHEGKDGLYFASEAKALMAVSPELGEFDPKGIGEFLTCGCTLGDRSLFQSVNVLPGGSLWTFKGGKVKKKSSYFNNREWIDELTLDEKQFAHHLVELFGVVVNRYYGGRLPVGISITGGLDSRMMMACLGKIQSGFPCYSFGSKYRDTFDVLVAREVARMCCKPYHVLVVGEEFLRDFSRYLEKAIYISDGYLGMSGAAELYVNSLARKIAPVRLTGNYGGELLRGDRAFKYEVPQGDFVSPELQLYLQEAQTTFQKLESKDRVTFAMFHQAPLQGYGRMSIERSQVVLRTPFMDNDLVELVYQGPRHLLKNGDLSVSIISRYNPDLLKISTDRGLLNNGSWIGYHIRRFHREALFKIEYMANNGMPAWLAAVSCRDFERFLQKNFLGRHKFHHFGLWSKKRFSRYMVEVLIDGSKDLGGFFNLNQVEAMVNEHIGGRRNYINEIDKLLTITLARKTLVNGGGLDNGQSIRSISSDVGLGRVRDA